jgi:hypothetical protein
MDENSQHDPTSPPADAALAEQLEEHGIVTVPSNSYEWGGFRYTNPRDAIAAAKRGKS